MSSKPAFDNETAFELLKARMDRGGLPITPSQEFEWHMALDAAVEELTGMGIRLTGTAGDYTLVKELATQKLLHRDQAGGYSEQLRADIRNRWLKDGDDN